MAPRARDRRSPLGAAIAAILTFAGCSSPGRLPPPRRPLVWPDPPETARIVLASQFRGARDLDLGTGLRRKIADWLFGRSDDRFRRPYAIAVAGTAPDGGPGRIAVADTEVKVVHLLDLAGGEQGLAADAGDDGPLESPVGVAFDAEGRLYVVDSAKRLLVRYDASGDFDRVLARDFARPAGLAIDRARGVVYVSDAHARGVRKLDLDGKALGPVPVPMQCPTHLSVDRDGRLLVSDALGFQVLVVSKEGELLGTIGRQGDATGDLSRPKGVGADSEGHVYVADASFDNVQIFDLAGEILLAFGAPGDAPGELALPGGLAIDEQDLIYVADAWNGRVQVFRYLKGEGGR